MGVFTIYLCLGGTWVPVVTEKGLLGLAKIAKVVLKFCVIPVSKWYLGIYFAENKLENGF